MLNFEAQAENIPADAVLQEMLKEVKEKADLMPTKHAEPSAAVRP